MARLYLDANVAERLAAGLRTLGHDVATTHQLGRKGTPDHRQLLYAATTDRTLVTHNAADFRLLHGAWVEWAAAWQVSGAAAQHHGILVLEQAQPAPPVDDLASAIHALLTAGADLANRLLTWTRAAGWQPTG